MSTLYNKHHHLISSSHQVHIVHPALSCFYRQICQALSLRTSSVSCILPASSVSACHTAHNTISSPSTCPPLPGIEAGASTWSAKPPDYQTSLFSKRLSPLGAVGSRRHSESSLELLETRRHGLVLVCFARLALAPYPSVLADAPPSALLA